MCVFRSPDSLNVLPHSRHLYGFSPLWILLCLTRWSEVVNRLLQTVHSNGFSPEWLRLCTVNSLLVLKHFPHSVHLYLLLWTFTCIFKLCWVVKRFLHWLHEYNFPVLCICLWCFKLSFVANRLSHTVYKYGLGLSSCGCSVISLLSASTFTSKVIPTYAKHTCTHSKYTTECHTSSETWQMDTSHWYQDSIQLTTH